MASVDQRARRTQPAPVLSDHVRARLDALLAEAPPRRAVWEGIDDPDRTRARVAPGSAEQAATGPLAAAQLTTGRRFTQRHLVVVAAILALGVLVALYALTRARAIPLEPVRVEPAPAPAVAPSATERSATPTPAPLRVHVLGAVQRPGLVSVPSGSRVQDALQAAGGLRADARPGELNLAAQLTDGQQILVGDLRRPGGQVRGAEPAAGATPGRAAGSAASRGKVDLNSATAEQLDALPGVGPVTAQKIVAWRTEHQRFSKVAELQEVPGIGPKSYAELEPLVSVS